MELTGETGEKVENKNNQPKISIITCVYAAEKYIRKCLDSLLVQSYKNLEFVIVDDGSPDKCPEICDEYAAKDARIHLIHQKNAGYGVARNGLVKKSAVNKLEIF